MNYVDEFFKNITLKEIPPWFKSKVFKSVVFTSFTTIIIVVVIIMSALFHNSSNDYSDNAISDNPSGAPTIALVETLRPSYSSAPSVAPTSFVFGILADFYKSTSGGSWIEDSNWLSSDVSVCEWFRVYCYGGGLAFSRGTIYVSFLSGG